MFLPLITQQISKIHDPVAAEVGRDFPPFDPASLEQANNIGVAVSALGYSFSHLDFPFRGDIC
jgi:hypothetical protein